MSLHPYQEKGVQWLAARKCAILADPPGYGKSCQVIGALDAVNAQRVMLVAPAIARENWANEFRKWQKIPRTLAVRKKGRQAFNPRAGVQIVSYEGVQPLLPMLGDTRFDALVVDEAHFLKSPCAKRTITILGKGGLWKRAARLWTMTGTPMPNHPGELWTQLYAFGATGLGRRDFIERYCEFAGGERIYQEGMTKIIGARRDRMAELRSVLARVMLRRVHDIGLPPLLAEEYVVDPGAIEFPPEHVRRAEATALEMGLALARMDTETAARWIESCATSVATLRRYTGLRKIKPAAEIVRWELAAQCYDKVVLFCIHKDVAYALADEMQKFNPVVITGETSDCSRQRAIKRFQEEKGTQVLIANILAAGTAINLTACNEVVFVEMDWVPANNEQAAKRCHRIGQKRPVRVRTLALRDSVDQKIAGVLRRKMSDIKSLDER